MYVCEAGKGIASGVSRRYITAYVAGSCNQPDLTDVTEMGEQCALV